MRTNQVNQVIRHSRTTFGAVVVNVNKRSVSADARAFTQNYLLGVDLFDSKRKTRQNVTLGLEQLCSVKHNSKLSSLNSLWLSPPTLPLPQKKNMKLLGAAILLGAAQARSRIQLWLVQF